MGQPSQSRKSNFHSGVQALTPSKRELIDSHDGLEKTHSERWIDYWLTEDDNHLCAQIYYSKLPISDHDPMRERAQDTGEYGKLRAGIFEYGSPVTKVIAPEVLRQCPKAFRKDHGGSPEIPAYLIQARLRVTINGLSSRIEWEILKPNVADGARVYTQHYVSLLSDSETDTSRLSDITHADMMTLGNNSLINSAIGVGIHRGGGPQESSNTGRTLRSGQVTQAHGGQADKRAKSHVSSRKRRRGSSVERGLRRSARLQSSIDS